ncbi:MAG TPA: hypothetical protein VHJ99_13070 [Candidatus Dormibacteraeota bacterium]|nr:hypothetical protein [Candidatus Dormibacteraeota bacterium]
MSNSAEQVFAEFTPGITLVLVTTRVPTAWPTAAVERLSHPEGVGHFNPTGLAIDGGGDVFVVDSANGRIQELSPAGRYMAQWQAPLGGFKFVSKVALDDHGNMYVSVGSEVFPTVVLSPR